MLKKYSCIFAMVLVVCFAFSLSSYVFAGTETTVSTIAELKVAIDNLKDGDTIVLKSGIYDVSKLTEGYLSINQNNVTIKGDSSVTISGSTKPYVIGTSANNVTLDGFNIDTDTSGSYYLQNAIKCNIGGSQKFTGLTIKNISIKQSMDSAINVSKTDNVNISKVTFGPLKKGFGISLTDSANVVIDGCNFKNLSSSATSNIALYYVGRISKVTVNNCTYCPGIPGAYNKRGIKEMIGYNSITMDGKIPYEVPYRGKDYEEGLLSSSFSDVVSYVYSYANLGSYIIVCLSAELLYNYAPSANIPTNTSFNSSISIKLSCSYSGSTIYYTTDGSDPLMSPSRSLKYTAPLNLTGTTTIRARSTVIKNGITEWSPLVTFSYTKTPSNAGSGSTGSGSAGSGSAGSGSAGSGSAGSGSAGSGSTGSGSAGSGSAGNSSVGSTTIKNNKVALSSHPSSVGDASCWRQDSAGWWLETGQNSYAKSEWKSVNNIWYFFNDDGYMATDWVFSNNQWYHLEESGAMTTGWLLNNNKWYFLNLSGDMATGWILNDGIWYYLNESGDMTTQPVVYQGKQYQFDQSGACINP